ncbi:hypothetical protein TeGR_g4090 [Tetraparma gracilis]|uniref:SHOCT domain-containing protein n=1 Tax=Tetraparma gracilis TaxID=2962635 RepID=A0ABQ6MRY2_9STRA|nr:hypothetical protein TeGR_g4090 [Tetraparma gracilis]
MARAAASILSTSSSHADVGHYLSTLRDAGKLHKQGVLDDEEFEELKRDIKANMNPFGQSQFHSDNCSVTSSLGSPAFTPVKQRPALALELPAAAAPPPQPRRVPGPGEFFVSHRPGSGHNQTTSLPPQHLQYGNNHPMSKPWVRKLATQRGVQNVGGKLVASPGASNTPPHPRIPLRNVTNGGGDNDDNDSSSSSASSSSNVDNSLASMRASAAAASYASLRVPRISPPQAAASRPRPRSSMHMPASQALHGQYNSIPSYALPPPTLQSRSLPTSARRETPVRNFRQSDPGAGLPKVRDHNRGGRIIGPPHSYREEEL